MTCESLCWLCVCLLPGESFIPIVVMALIPFAVEPRYYGTAFGLVEVSECLDHLHPGRLADQETKRTSLPTYEVTAH